jgi:hypothetical protein
MGCALVYLMSAAAVGELVRLFSNECRPPLDEVPALVRCAITLRKRSLSESIEAVKPPRADTGVSTCTGEPV